MRSAWLRIPRYVPHYTHLSVRQGKMRTHSIRNGGLTMQRFPVLGRVDELFDDNPHGDEMNQSQKGLTQFLIPRGNAPKLLEVVEEPFHLLTSLVEVFLRV